MIDIVPGLRIVESLHVTKTVEFQRRRSWRERLFSRPWQPLVSEATDYREEPLENYYVLDGMVVCHPAVAERLRQELAALPQR